MILWCWRMVWKGQAYPFIKSDLGFALRFDVARAQLFWPRGIRRYFGVALNSREKRTRTREREREGRRTNERDPVVKCNLNDCLLTPRGAYATTKVYRVRVCINLCRKRWRHESASSVLRERLQRDYERLFVCVRKHRMQLSTSSLGLYAHSTLI